MGANIAARAATAGELLKLRSEGQWSELHLAIQPATVIYSARINQEFDTLDGVYELTYDGGTGTLADVLVNMTVFVGSSAGASDKGILRIRQLPTSDKFYFNATSHVQFANDDWLTVIDAMPLWPKQINNAGRVVRVDWDVMWGDADAQPPVPVLGPMVAVVRLTGATVNFTPPLPTRSFSPSGAAISSYLYACPGASATSGLGTTTPIFTFNAAGWYRFSCTVTDALGKTSTGHRWIVVEPESPEFDLESCEGNISSGGWSFTVNCFADVALSDVQDRALCILWATDYYDETEGSIGPIEGYENVIAVGWIDGESIDADPISGLVRFTVHGPAYWMQKVQSAPIALTDSSAAATSWTEIQNLTVDKVLFFLLYWCSNVMQIMDVILTGNSTRVALLPIPAGVIWDQMKSLAEDRLLASPLVNRFGQLFVEIDSQFLSSADRAALPVVMAITSVDWHEQINIERLDFTPTAFLEVAGFGPYDGTSMSLPWSHAPGTMPQVHGDIQARQNFLFADQAECNRIAGALLAVLNNPYPSAEVPLASNHRLVDICPRQYLTITLAAGDTPRGITWTDQRLIPRRVSLEIGTKSREIMWRVHNEVGAVGVDGVTYYPPIPPEDNLPDVSIPDVGFEDLPGLGTWVPPLIPPDPGLADCAGDNDAQGNGPYSLNFDHSSIVATDAAPYARAYFPCTIRASSAIYKTQIIFSLAYIGDAASHVHIYAIDSGNNILVTGSIAGTLAQFTPALPTAVAGFRLELDDDGLPPGDEFQRGNILQSGEIDITTSVGTEITGLEVGEYYALESSDGPWTETDFKDHYDQTGTMGSTIFLTLLSYDYASARDTYVRVKGSVRVTNNTNTGRTYTATISHELDSETLATESAYIPVGASHVFSVEGDYETHHSANSIIRLTISGGQAIGQNTSWDADYQVAVDDSPINDNYNFSTDLDDLGWSGNIGWYGPDQEFKLSAPSGSADIDDIDGLHGVVFFQASQESVRIRVPAVDWSKTSGDLGWVLREALFVTDRQVFIQNATLWNVCQ